MHAIHDFIRWALTHVKRSSIPAGAELPLPAENCGTEPWQYLFGSVRVKTTQDTLDRYYENHYKDQMTRSRYDQLTESWNRTGYATDCQGLLDAWLTYEAGEQTDINADTNYRYWCSDKGGLSATVRPFVIGEAVFHSNGSRMTHVGWICGFIGGEPLVVEAKSIKYGVLVTRLSAGTWTHRGLMTAKFDYEKEESEMIKFEVVIPMHQGETYKQMQQVLNACGYTDHEDKPLEVDGKWGKRSQIAFNKFIAAYAAELTEPEPEAPAEPPTVKVRPIMIYHKGDHGEYTVHVFNTADLPEA